MQFVPRGAYSDKIVYDQSIPNTSNQSHQNLGSNLQ